MAVLDRVVVNIVDVAGEVRFIADGVLPIAALPDSALALAQAAVRNPFTARQSARERRLEQTPSRRKIGVAFGQGPNRMEMVGKYDDCVDRERMAQARRAKCRPQQIDVLGQEPQATFRQIDGEEEGAARNEIAPVVGHGSNTRQ